jgi:long-chain acyl-CoA synthetase
MASSASTTTRSSWRTTVVTSRPAARQKCPRSVDFEAELPRLPTGKLYKRVLRDRYWGDQQSRIV